MNQKEIHIEIFVLFLREDTLDIGTNPHFVSPAKILQIGINTPKPRFVLQTRL